jgi:CRP-like cAMP-binding protein
MPFLHNRNMNSAPTRPIPEPSSWEPLKPVSGEAVLPAGVQLADEDNTGQHCFIILEGRANVEVAGRRLGELSAGAFVGLLDQDGRPMPPSGLTVQLATLSRVLVINASRLAELVNSDPAAATALHQLADKTRTLP